MPERREEYVVLSSPRREARDRVAVPARGVIDRFSQLVVRREEEEGRREGEGPRKGDEDDREPGNGAGELTWIWAAMGRYRSVVTGVAAPEGVPLSREEGVPRRDIVVDDVVE